MPNDDWRPKLTRIEDPIADDFWEYLTPQGQRRISRLTVGRPVHYPEARAWYCPILIEGSSPLVDTVFGQGPVDALMNAMAVVRTFFEQNFSVVPGAKPKVIRRKRPDTARRREKNTAKAASPLEKSRKVSRSKPRKK
ncbi:MAG: hypothetical protein ACJ8AT_29340 [Hyalangium sp.]|uniref:hypothetical protein n=1 Tax=Hyalangium sp. TaxID=2028555 RepID=UPI003899A206